jgi:SnoaL-like protein
MDPNGTREQPDRVERQERSVKRRGLLVGAAPASPLAAIFERNHVGWVTKDPDRIASLASEDTIFWLHDGSDPVTGRDALRRHCAELFAAFDFSHVVGRMLYGKDHWTLEWTMVLSLAEPDGSPFTARVEMLDVVTVDEQGKVTRKDVYMNGKQARAAYARAGIER